MGKLFGLMMITSAMLLGCQETDETAEEPSTEVESVTPERTRPPATRQQAPETNPGVEVELGPDGVRFDLDSERGDGRDVHVEVR